jgi:hypothetical protein
MNAQNAQEELDYQRKITAPFVMSDLSDCEVLISVDHRMHWLAGRFGSKKLDKAMDWVIENSGFHSDIEDITGMDPETLFSFSENDASGRILIFGGDINKVHDAYYNTAPKCIPIVEKFLLSVEERLVSSAGCPTRKLIIEMTISDEQYDAYHGICKELILEDFILRFNEPERGISFEVLADTKEGDELLSLDLRQEDSTAKQVYTNEYSFVMAEKGVIITIITEAGKIVIHDSNFDSIDAAESFMLNLEAYELEGYDMLHSPFDILSLMIHSQQQGQCDVYLNNVAILPVNMRDTNGAPGTINPNTVVLYEGRETTLGKIISMKGDTA